MILRIAFGSTLMLLGACGSQSNEDALENAANQSDPAAAAVLNGAAENGMDPQQALEEAGQAAARTAADPTPAPVQARPNRREQPNPPAPGEPPEKVASGNDSAAENEHAGHNME